MSPPEDRPEREVNPLATIHAEDAPLPDAKPLAPGLYLVGTPIGNLEDITLRALRVLGSVDRIACEDTRQTQKLLNHFGIRKATVSYHAHNEQGRSKELIDLLQAGARIAAVTDAGLPGVADPGEVLVRMAIAAGIPVVPVPGANAALTALIVSGLSAERFSFHGFLPAKEGQRRTALEALRKVIDSGDESDAMTHIFYEAPHRLLESLADLQTIFGPRQQIVLARELTKIHEEFLRGPVEEVTKALASRDKVRGEMVLLLEGRQRNTKEEAAALTGGTLADDIFAAMAAGASEKDALKAAAKSRGLGKSEAYREWQRARRR